VDFRIFYLFSLFGAHRPNYRLTFIFVSHIFLDYWNPITITLRKVSAADIKLQSSRDAKRTPVTFSRYVYAYTCRREHVACARGAEKPPETLRTLSASPFNASNVFNVPPRTSSASIISIMFRELAAPVDFYRRDVTSR